MRLFELVDPATNTVTPMGSTANQTTQPASAGAQTPALQANPVEKQKQRSRIQDQIRQLEQQLADLRKQLSSTI